MYTIYTFHPNGNAVFIADRERREDALALVEKLKTKRPDKMYQIYESHE